jgi:DNA-binding transcriptional ArsR family regulator
MSAPADPRLILRDEELDAGLELMMLAEASLWAGVDAGLEAEAALGVTGLGRSHWRAAFLLKRRPGLGVQDLARLTSLSKQAASRVLSDLEAKGLAEKAQGDLDGRRRAASADNWPGPIARAGWTAWPGREPYWARSPAGGARAELRSDVGDRERRTAPAGGR